MNYLRKRNFDLMNREFFKDFFEPSFVRQSVMRTDIREDEKQYFLDIEVPGIAKENIQITMEDGYLNISATTSSHSDEQNENYLRKERHYGSYSRNFYVGDLKREEIGASCTNGILTVTVPKTNPQEEEKKYINIDWN